MGATVLRRNRHALAFGLLLLGLGGRLCAEEVLSNLTNRWIDPGGPGAKSIGEILALGPYYPFTVHFFTGGQAGAASLAVVTPSSVDATSRAGPPLAPPTNAASFQLNWVTFEFIGNHLQHWNDALVDLYQQVGTNGELVGELNIVAVDPRLTQWPESSNPPWFCTTYVDFLPTTNIFLQPQSEYYVSMTPRGSELALLFGLSSNYTGFTGWRMGPTSTGYAPGPGEFIQSAFIKFAVDVTAKTGPSSSGNTGLSNVNLSATKMGTNLLLRWPASPYRLYSTERVESNVWHPVTETPFRSDSNLLVSVTFSNLTRCFRLKAP